MYIQCTSIFFFLFSYSTSVSLCYNDSFLYKFLPIHSKAPNGVLDKWIFEFSEAPIHYYFGENNYSEYFWQLSSKTSMLESLLSTLRSFWRSSSEQLFCRELVCTCFCKKGIPHHTLSQEFSRILKICKAKGCSLLA